jgi:hypothetical protein
LTQRYSGWSWLFALGLRRRRCHLSSNIQKWLCLHKQLVSCSGWFPFWLYLSCWIAPSNVTTRYHCYQLPIVCVLFHGNSYVVYLHMMLRLLRVFSYRNYWHFDTIKKPTCIFLFYFILFLLSTLSLYNTNINLYFTVSIEYA